MLTCSFSRIQRMSNLFLTVATRGQRVMRTNFIHRTSLLALALALTVGAADVPAQPQSTVPTDEARARALYGVSPRGHATTVLELVREIAKCR